MNLRLNFFLFILIFLSSSCIKWELKEHWGIGAWSEDDKAIAITKLSYEMENKGFGAETRNHLFQVNTALVSNINKTKARGPEMKGQVQKLFYMRDRDYVITKTLQKNEASEKHVYYQFLGNGKVRTLGTVPVKRAPINCEGESWIDEINEVAAFIPSPDGSYIASVRLNLTCEGVKAHVKFLNPDDGSIVSKETIPLPLNMVGAWQDGNKKFFNTQNKFAWNESGEFMLGFEELKNNVVTNRVVGWLMGPEKDSTELENLDYSCFAPSTTSSYYSSNGKFINSSTENDNLSIVSQSGKVDIFGCH